MIEQIGEDPKKKLVYLINIYIIDQCERDRLLTLTKQFPLPVKGILNAICDAAFVRMSEADRRIVWNVGSTI